MQTNMEEGEGRIEESVGKKRMETYEQKELQSDLYRKQEQEAETDTKKDSINNDSD